MFNIRQKYEISKFKKNSLDFKNLLSNNIIQFFIDSNCTEELDDYTLINTDDLSSGQHFIGKLIYSDKISKVYVVIPSSIRTKYGYEVLKDIDFLEDIFSAIPSSFVLKHSNHDGSTEYATHTLTEIIRNIKQEDINKLKPMIFPKLYTLDDIVTLIDPDLGQYSLVAKKTNESNS